MNGDVDIVNRLMCMTDMKAKFHYINVPDYHKDPDGLKDEIMTARYHKYRPTHGEDQEDHPQGETHIIVAWCFSNSPEGDVKGLLEEGRIEQEEQEENE